MIKPDLYKKTVDILFDAYFNDTLEHGNCAKCAVGNIISGNLGVTDEQLIEPHSPVWVINGKETGVSWGDYMGFGDVSLDAEIITGYNTKEINMIEAAFECADMGESKEDFMFNGLVSVLECLKRIHQIEDNTADVLRFRNQYELKSA